MNYKQKAINNLAIHIKSKGYRVFISGSKDYGLFTDTEGTRIISFGTDICEIVFTGNYKTNKPKQTGTGWRLPKSSSGNYHELFHAYPPPWAVGNCKWRYTTLKEHLDFYQQSSKYIEI